VTFTAVPFNASGQKATVDQWQTMGSFWAPSGVSADAPAITVSGLTFTIPALLKAWVHGFLGENAEDLTVDGVSNTSTLPRIDRLILRVSKTGKSITPMILEGTAAAQPQLPTATFQPTTDIDLAYATKPGSGSAQNYANLVINWQPVSTDRRRNAFSGSGTIGSSLTALTNWTNIETDGLITRSGGNFTVARPGRWAFHVKAGADTTQDGQAIVRVVWPGGPWSHLPEELLSFKGSGRVGGIDVPLSWSGLVLPSEIAQPFQLLCFWNPASGSASAAFHAVLTAEYLGA
jgi:hypothetical protein